ncbi:PIN domain-containing protein [Methylotenera sp.]|uniref:PIN domain-containing protein n=1 Tax=Methylotenera sp. TaxID=2051956 RepID=UPI002732389A|nr:type II toxin-antitoxin system VapC family toxin [Methylotenera sp.]MDP3307498.1 type II toxin-antitoxin system VapC family toxin [Methylotenera sp.]
MIGLDTNVIVRYIAQDDVVQSPMATQLVESLSNDNLGFITLIAIAELVWVMQGCYQASKEETVTILQGLLHTREFVVENAEIVAKAVLAYAASNADFADCLIERSADYAKCTCTMTFDSNAAKTAGMLLVREK